MARGLTPLQKSHGLVERRLQAKPKWMVTTEAVVFVRQKQWFLYGGFLWRQLEIVCDLVFFRFKAQGRCILNNPF